MNKIRRLSSLLLAFLLTFLMVGCGEISASDVGQIIDGAQSVINDAQGVINQAQTVLEALQQTTASGENGQAPEIDADGEYSSKAEVAAYLHAYNHLPSNYLTKSEAEALGWVASKGNLWEVAPGKSIGGDRFGNREGILPEKKGRQYYECDIDYAGGTRNAKRIVYSSDGLIFYTEDHYTTFEQLY